MNDLFENLLNENRCQKNGICSTNPVLNALDAVILNEIRQISFYVVRLKEFNFTNKEIMKQAVFALSVNITDTNFNERDLICFYSKLRNLKNEIKDFYTKKCKELNISFEFVTQVFETNKEKIETTDLIKGGESIIRQFYNKMPEEKNRLLNLIILIVKMASIDLLKLSSYTLDIEDYCFETLRILSLTNNTGTREEKLIRRIKEFSNISYKIKEELNLNLQKAYGKRTDSIADTSIYEGRCILILGGDLDELYNLLNNIKNEKINVYLDPTMLLAPSYPVFQKFKNLKGVFGGSDVEHDFSKFKGAIYVTKNCTKGLDTAFRGTIFTTKEVAYDKAVKIENNNLTPLIEEAKKQEGFLKNSEKEKFEFEFNLNDIEKLIKENENEKFLVALGTVDKKEELFKDKILINFKIPYETEGLYYVLEKISNKNLSVYFSKCTTETISTTVSILDKKLEEIYMKSCQNLNINPHITDSLKKDFNIKFI